MAQRRRYDAPGRFHHIMNRGSRREVIFTNRRDYRRFMALVACSVRRGELRVEALSILGTHFHMLAGSPAGNISYALMRIQNAYARYRNRRRGEDGPLFRARFLSKPVRSRTYWRTLIRYIDQNPVKAGLCSHPFEYPYGTARLYADGGRMWLYSRRIAHCLCSGSDRSESFAEQYARVFGAPLSSDEYEVIERRLSQRRWAEDRLEQLMAAPPPAIARWMAKKVKAAGASPWLPMASARSVRAAAMESREREGPWPVSTSRKHRNGWELLEIGLMHTLVALGVEALSREYQCSSSTISRRLRAHKELLLGDPTYAERAGLVSRRALDLTFPT